MAERADSMEKRWPGVLGKLEAWAQSVELVGFMGSDLGEGKFFASPEEFLGIGAGMVNYALGRSGEKLSVFSLVDGGSVDFECSMESLDRGSLGYMDRTYCWAESETDFPRGHLSLVCATKSLEGWKSVSMGFDDEGRRRYGRMMDEICAEAVDPDGARPVFGVFEVNHGFAENALSFLFPVAEATVSFGYLAPVLDEDRAFLADKRGELASFAERLLVGRSALAGRRAVPAAKL